MSKKVYSERIVVIGASQSGKTFFACNEIVPHFMYVHYIGPRHNIKDYANALNKKASMNIYSNPLDAHKILLTAEEFCFNNPKKSAPPQLIVFDDVIDKDFVKTTECRDLFCAGRHVNLTIVVMAHSPNVVVTPVMKCNSTQIVICQWYRTNQFDEIIEEYLKGMMFDGKESKSELNARCNKMMQDIFKYKYAKLIIRPLDNTYSAMIPAKKELRPESYTKRPVIPWQLPKNDKIYNKFIQENEECQDETEEPKDDI